MIKKMRIMVTGGRDFNDYGYLVASMESVVESGLLKGLKIILSDGKQGPGIVAERFAEEYGLFVEKYTNDDILKADALVVFWNGNLLDLNHKIENAQKKGIPIWIFPYDKNCPLYKREEVVLHSLEAQWQKKKAEEIKKMAEQEGELFSFKQANGIELNYRKDEHDNREITEEDIEEFWAWCRHGMTGEQWAAYKNIIYREKQKKWKEFAPWIQGDFDYEEIFSLLKFKLELMVDYFKQFSHCTMGEYIQHQLETAYRLLNIIIKHGNENEDIDVFPYQVNMRNAYRFEARHCGYSFMHDEPQKVRYSKAFCIFFKYLERNIRRWWD